jgi:hypothetical protein
MNGADDLAAAVHEVMPDLLLFPAEGVITRLNVSRGVTGVGPVLSVSGLQVVVNGVPYDCGASGAFIAEIGAASASSSYAGDDFVGRHVKVESLGGRLLVAYTVNWG